MFLHTLRAVAVTGLLAMTPMFATAQTADPTEENQATVGPTQEEMELTVKLAEIELEAKLALLRGQAEPMIAYYTGTAGAVMKDLQTPFNEEFFKEKLAESGFTADESKMAKIEQMAREYYAKQQAEIGRSVVAPVFEHIALLEASVRGNYAGAERALTLATKLDPENTVYRAELEAVQRLRALHQQGKSGP